ncbi:hypothetical protein ACERK3_17200 [Phycisphaerales bacterium AB-hyl4]|uniref:HEXXH motif-containing protein n=1 Tax=Natronomicrosphaera hydrolytica TaxID=3242702 RepID=A0ABV4U8S3_9BACT
MSTDKHTNPRTERAEDARLRSPHSDAPPMKVDVTVDDRFRAIAAILLLTPWVDVNARGADGRRWREHPIRQQVRALLAMHEDHPFVRLTRAQYESVGDFSTYFLLAAILSQEEGRWAVNQSAYEVTVARGGTAGHLRAQTLQHMLADRYLDRLYDFVLATDLPGLWRKQASEWALVVNDCRAVLKHRRIPESITSIFGRTGTPLRLIPVPEAPATTAFGPGDASTAYCCLGPPNVAENEEVALRFRLHLGHTGHIIFHEFAHTLWADASSQCPDFAARLQPLRDQLTLKGYLATHTPPWPLLLDEIMVRVATILYIEQVDGSETAQRQIRHEHDDYGLTCVEPATEGWRNLLMPLARREASLPALLPTLASRLLKSGR